MVFRVEDIDETQAPLLDHLVELRTRLIWAMLSFAICFAVAYYFSERVYYFLALPLADVLRESGGHDPKLIYTQLYEAFFTRIKVAFFGGAFMAFPVIAAQLWLFVAPGLYRSEKKALLPFLAATPVLFFLGASLAYFFVLPMAWRFFAGFQTQTGGGGVPMYPPSPMSAVGNGLGGSVFGGGGTYGSSGSSFGGGGAGGGVGGSGVVIVTEFYLSAS